MKRGLTDANGVIYAYSNADGLQPTKPSQRIQHDLIVDKIINSSTTVADQNKDPRAFSDTPLQFSEGFCMGTVNDENTLNIVLIDDNHDHLSLMSATVRNAFISEPFEISTQEFDNPATALTEISKIPNQIILIDYQFATSTGLDWLSNFVRANAGPVILVTSSGDESIAAKSFREGAADYIVKSEAIKNPAIIQRSIHEALRKSRLVQLNHDLSSRLKLANYELNIKNRKLSELTDTAHQFVEDVAHEFRTPLTVIKEFASIIADGLGGEVTEKQSQYLNHITSSASDLAGLIDDFLNSSRLRSNSICVNRQQHTVDEIFNAVWPILESRAGSKSIELVRDVDSNLPDIYIDSDKMQRSLINLVVNAIKFSEQESVVRVSATMNDSCMVEIAVHDNGPGLPQQTITDLFERFNQGGQDTSRLANGFGLGLNIVKELVTINLGVVKVESTVGVGSTFSFTVPIANNQSILRGLVSQTSKHSGDPRIVVLSVNRTHDDQPIDQLAEYLNTMSYPMDLVLYSGGKSCLLLIGITTEEESFRQRILKVDSEMRSKKLSPHSDLQISICGKWSADEAESRILELIEESVQKGHYHVEVNLNC